MPQAPERPRVEEFRLGLAERLSNLSQEPAVRAEMRTQPLETLMNAYVHYTIRSVAPRPRKVRIKAGDAKWKSLASRAAPLLALAESGGAIMPYHCFAPHLRNFAVAGAAFEEWTDKDLLLNVLGFHFFQLEPEGAKRSGDHILVHADRENFTVIGAFDGKGFAGDGPERGRAWKMLQARGIKPISRMYLNQFALERVLKLREIDPRLDDPEFVRQLYAETDTPMPAETKWKWQMPFLDFGFLEETAPRFFMIWPGPK